MSKFDKYKMAKLDPAEMDPEFRQELYTYVYNKAFGSHGHIQFDKVWVRIIMRLWEYERTQAARAFALQPQINDIARLLYGTLPNSDLLANQSAQPDEVLRLATGFLEDSKAVQVHRQTYQSDLNVTEVAFKQAMFMCFQAAHFMFSTASKLTDYWHLKDNPAVSEFNQTTVTVTFVKPLWAPCLGRVRTDLTDIGCDIKCIINRDTSTLHQLIIQLDDYSSDQWKKLLTKVYRRISTLEPIE